MNRFWAFVDRFKSWQVELVSGLLCVVLALLAKWLAGPVWGLAVIATILSLFYEHELDHNGFSWKDVAQRQVGIVAGALLWALL